MFTELKKRKRKYVLKARGEQVSETKARITDAILHLHRTVGPRHATISAIAERAGVERLTVYRHFPDADAIFAACTGRFLESNPPPQTAAWALETEPLARTRRALGELYGYFSRTSDLYGKAYADRDEIPALDKVMQEFDAYLASLARDLSQAWPQKVRAPHRLIILRHAVRFATWQSFEALEVGDEQKVHLILEWLKAAPAA